MINLLDSQIKTDLKQVTSSKLELDFDGIAEFLVFGVILGNKTMIKGMTLPLYKIPEIIIRSSSNLDDVYNALENAIENIVQEEPNSAISLSGGLDSRIIAGIVAKLGYDLPAITYYSPFEAKIASKICDKLKLEHYYAPFNYKIDKSFLKKVVSLIVELGGTNDIVTLVNYLKQETLLQNLGKSGIIGGGRFNEVLGLNLICKEKKIQKNHLKKLGYNYYPRKILNKAYYNLYSYCSQMTPNEFYLTILVQRNLNRAIKLSYKLPNIKYPVLDQNVLSTIYSLPTNERINKNLQRRILKKYFPELYCIPTNNSIRPYLDFLTLKMVRILEYIQRRRGLNRPINTFGVEYFFEKNNHIFLKKFKNIPIFQNEFNFIISLALQNLRNKRIYYGTFMRRVITFLLLFDALKG